MKSHKNVWIATLCLLSAIAVAVAFTARTTKVQAAKHVAPKSPTSLAQPAVYLASPALRNAMLADNGPSRVSGNLQATANPTLPPVEEFTLTPPNPEKGITKTILSVRFPESQAAEKLASGIPVTLGKQNVVLKRSGDDGRVFSTQVEFDWQAFAREQQIRKSWASAGKMVPVYDGPIYLRKDSVPFVEPEEILGALKSHESIQFGPPVLNSCPNTTVVNDHELMIVNPAVVEDPGGRTFDPCLHNPNSNQSPNGAWTFQTLMMGIRNGNLQQAEQMLMDWLSFWENQSLLINGVFSVPARPGMAGFGTHPGLFAVWPRDTTGNMCMIGTSQVQCLSLANAPVRLNAIVNRIDLGGLPGETPIGELRFVFGVSASLDGTCASTPPTFNIILEFGVPQNNNIPTINAWANAWNALQTLPFDDNPGDFMAQLQTTITNLVVTPGACPGNTNGSCLAQIRTNELELSGNTFWEQRQFALPTNAGQNQELTEVTISQTPDGSFTGFSGSGNLGAPPCSGSQSPNGCSTHESFVSSFITQNQTQLDNGTYVVLPNFQNVPFLGGSAFNGPDPIQTAYWNGNPSSFQHKERVIFSEGTCNGCHGTETEVRFQQVVNRLPGQAPSALSGFLVGCNNGGTVLSGGSSCPNMTCTPQGQENDCVFPLNMAQSETVQDPVLGSGTNNVFEEIVRRNGILQCLVTDGPQSGGLLWPLARPRINFVH